MEASPLLAMLAGAQNGASYGARIRLPHALIMTFLFQKGSLESKLRRIIQVLCMVCGDVEAQNQASLFDS